MTNKKAPRKKVGKQNRLSAPAPGFSEDWKRSSRAELERTSSSTESATFSHEDSKDCHANRLLSSEITIHSNGECEGKWEVWNNSRFSTRVRVYYVAFEIEFNHPSNGWFGRSLMKDGTKQTWWIIQRPDPHTISINCRIRAWEGMWPDISNESTKAYARLRCLTYKLQHA